MACLEAIEEQQQFRNLKISVLGGDNAGKFVFLVKRKILCSRVRCDACYLRHQPVDGEILSVRIVYVVDCRVVAHHGSFGIATEVYLCVGVYLREETRPISKFLPHEFSFEPRDLRGTRLSADGVRHSLETLVDVD